MITQLTLNTQKAAILTGLGFIGTGFVSLLGGWDKALQTLLIFIVIDYITGLIVAGIFRKSAKTPTGGLNSTIGLKGIFKKVGEFILVVVASLLDGVLGLSVIRYTVIIALVANEVLSIIENLGLMGVPIPKIIRKAIDLLNEKGGETDGENNSESA